MRDIRTMHIFSSIKSMANALRAFLVGLATLCLLSLAFGCTTTGNVARFEMRSVAGVTSATFGNYNIPVISIATGPSATVWQTKDVPCWVQFSGNACITNTTTALGLYTSTEEKHLDFDGIFSVNPTSTTNTTQTVVNRQEDK